MGNRSAQACCSSQGQGRGPCCAGLYRRAWWLHLQLVECLQWLWQHMPSRALHPGCGWERSGPALVVRTVMPRGAVAPLAQQDTNWSAAPRNAAMRRRKIVLPSRGYTACHCMFTFCSSLLLGVPAVPARYSATHNDKSSHPAKAAADPGVLLVVLLRRRYTTARACARASSRPLAHYQPPAHPSPVDKGDGGRESSAQQVRLAAWACAGADCSAGWRLRRRRGRVKSVSSPRFPTPSKHLLPPLSVSPRPRRPHPSPADAADRLLVANLTLPKDQTPATAVACQNEGIGGLRGLHFQRPAPAPGRDWLQRPILAAGARLLHRPSLGYRILMPGLSVKQLRAPAHFPPP